ncbi:MAG TPA: hypothetical protein VN894_08000, partial [Polyangiaceae bacterium]|nr:hypothetical protein [Polyangiaceae bacterium]
AADSGSSSTAPSGCTSQGQCVNHGCANGGHTTISGTVYDPAGVNPLYNVAVYVPQSPPSPLPAGASCYTCQSLYTGGVVAGTLTDAAGNFSIVDAPTGSAVPLIVQIGKWRRQYTIDVADCANTPQPTLRLPANASEGDLPNIAVSTGGADSLECLLRRIGVDAGGNTGGTGEYVNGAGGGGHIHIFQGGTNAPAGINGNGNGGGGATGASVPGATMAGGSPASATALWTSGPAMQPYDIVLLSCEGGETASSNPQALNDYAGLGGRVFASHFHYSWFNQAPFAAYNLATWTRGTNNTGNINALIQTTLSDRVTPFPKGIAMQQWLTNVNALASVPPELPIQVSRHNADVSAANTPSTAWIVADPLAPSPGATQYFSWDMPVPNPTQQPCGRVVYSDLHVGAASADYGQGAGTQNVPAGAITPSGCANNSLSPQEKALEFMLFDLSSCLTPVSQKPQAPGTAE